MTIMVTVLVAVAPHCRTCWIVGPALNRASWIGSKRSLAAEYAIICNYMHSSAKNRMKYAQNMHFIQFICLNYVICRKYA